MSIKKLVLALAIITVVSFSIAGIVLVNTGVGGIVKLASQYDPARLDETKAVPVGSIKELKIRTVAENIKLIPVDTQEIKVHMYGDVSDKSTAPKLVTDLSSDTLTIKVDYGVTLGINRGKANLTLDVEVPRDFKGDLQAQTVSGQITAENLTLNNVDAHSVAGSIRFGGLTSTQCTIETTSGDASIADLASNLTFNSISGDVDATYKVFQNNVRIKTTSGNITLRLPQNPDFALKYKSVSGNLTNEFASNQTGGTNLNLEQTIGKGGNNIEIQSVSGDAHILQ